MAKEAYRKGLIVKKDCEFCGDGNTEMHHVNYDEPLKVLWLCHRHHVMADTETRSSRWVSPEATRQLNDYIRNFLRTATPAN